MATRNRTTERQQALPADVRSLQLSTQLVGWLALLVFVAGTAYWAVHLPIFNLQAVVVTGEVARSSPALLQATVLPQLSGNFLTLDLRRTREAFQSSPWVRRAVVQRVWPMRLHAWIEEHREVALWGEPDDERLVNSHGEVFDAPVADVDGDRLARLVGPDGSSAQMLGMLQRLQAVLHPLGAGELVRLALSPRGSWRAELDKGAAIELGRGSDDEVVARTEQFVRIMPSVTEQYPRPLLSADLRHTGGFAVRLMGVTVTAAPTDPIKR